uniref:Rho-GAP domain-containing protein n=1 Tax=Glossina palpalis gambiensis TaxID=67801 RepID=A0A1B0BWL3_9MUSC
MEKASAEQEGDQMEQKLLELANLLWRGRHKGKPSVRNAAPYVRTKRLRLSAAGGTKNMPSGRQRSVCRRRAPARVATTKVTIPQDGQDAIRAEGTNKGLTKHLADYAPVRPPMIPALIVHCVHQIESRGSQQKGIYSFSGFVRKVEDLKDCFLKDKKIPQLDNIDVHVLAECIKDFLRF